MEKLETVYSGNPCFYAFVRIKEGKIESVGQDNFREGGIYWRRKFVNKEKMKANLTEVLVRQASCFGMDYYEDILEGAIEDAKWLPSAQKMKNLVFGSQLKDRQRIFQELLFDLKNITRKIEDEKCTIKGLEDEFYAEFVE